MGFGYLAFWANNRDSVMGYVSTSVYPLLIRRFLFWLALLPMSGCDTERLARLEKENEGLKAQISKSQVAADYDMQAK
jgi:hypothetical protein